MSAVVKWTFEDFWQGQGKTVAYYFQGSAVSFVVPDSVSMIRATLRGAPGGGESIDPVAGGGYLVVDIPVTGGETLMLRVGGRGGRVIPGLTGVTGGYNGGGDGGNALIAGHTGGYGGGGATDIRQGGDSLTNRVAVAAGGGGNSGEALSYSGGLGGGPTGGGGHSSAGPAPARTANYYGGKGGTQTAGGVHGVGGGSANDGARGQGGDGKNSTLRNAGGGGGGGLYGGGGGGIAGSLPVGDAGGGGGGSNGVADGVTIITNGRGSSGVNPQDAYLTLEYTEEADVYVFEINPNDGGTPGVTKNILMSQNVGPNRVGILQEGQSQAPVMAFSGVILAQAELEALEKWYDRRVLIQMTDDLGRVFYGVFSQFNPKRSRRATNVWYHTYDAQFTLSAYKNASGDWIYGRIL